MARDHCSRDRILDAATRLFHERGFQPTSLDDILAASGVCRSNLYYHFASKEELGLAVLDRLTKRFDVEVIQGILADAGVPAIRKMNGLIAAISEDMRSTAYRRGCPFGNLAAELAGVHPEFRARLSELFLRWEQAVERCLGEGIARGEFRADLDTAGIATAVVSQLEGAVLLTKAYGNERPIEAARSVLGLLESR